MATIETIYRMARHSHDISQWQGARFSMTGALSWLELQLEKRRSRRALLEMSDEQLKDIGLSRSVAYSEARRPLWD
jgi:uncharacterized protein YjiS (DUF1127 family)